MSKSAIDPVLARGFGRWFVILSLFFHQFPLLAFGAAAIASLDSDHEVLTSFDSTHIRIVLHHRAMTSEHRHGSAARLLTFGSSSSGEHADHELHFIQSGEKVSEPKNGEGSAQPSPGYMGTSVRLSHRFVSWPSLTANLAKCIPNAGHFSLRTVCLQV